ncbi:LacI family transcriptional regulator [Microbacterium luteolum]|uniref:LacI family transcriptional regulator n=1 Tax=Microbacterium luteolum TaxID=69367 RepID=A0ABY7XJU8_MICLT|nr:LacI family DNA-binding transcriptional regulator [Microbacterium luteolum]WDM42156.1 LacI family transcriptional regulator [Microbacterium luteolum]
MDDELPGEIAERIRRRNGAATIYDIAELAGVNPSTVSRALSKPGRISKKTEEKIRAAADRLDFQFNPMARALPTGRSHTIGLMVADITNPVIFGIVRGAEHTAAAAGYTLVIAESQESGEAEAEAVSRILPSVDGLILATTRLGDERITRLADRKPVILINRQVDGIVGVLPEVEQGVSDLVAHLADLGHTSIAYLSGPETSWISRRRWETLLDAAEGRGIAVVEIGPLSPTIDGGSKALRRVQASRATAAIAFNDLMAIGLIQAASSAGMRIPADLSIAGFDDIFGSELIVPALTTVRAQLQLAGERAVGKVLEALGDATEPVSDEPLATTLVVRGSTGPVPRL